MQYDHYTVYYEAYSVEMTIKGHSRSIAMIDSLDTIFYQLPIQHHVSIMLPFIAIY